MNVETPLCTVISQSISPGVGSYFATLRICGDTVDVIIVDEIEIQFCVLSRKMKQTFRETFHCVVQPSQTVELPVTFDLSDMKIPDDIGAVVLLFRLADKSKSAIVVDCGPDAIAALEAAREPVAGNAH